MERATIESLKTKLENLAILFIGDPARGKRLQQAVQPHGGKIDIAGEGWPAVENDGAAVPDLAILDDFPESERARSAYYHLRSTTAVPVLALNDAPQAIRFLHVNALSFIKIIDRNPAEKKLIDAIADLVSSHRMRPSCHWEACRSRQITPARGLRITGRHAPKACC